MGGDVSENGGWICGSMVKDEWLNVMKYAVSIVGDMKAQ
jgi:hypothetical protein